MGASVDWWQTFLDDEGNIQFLKSVAAALKPRARFALETGYVMETLLPVLQERSWYRGRRYAHAGAATLRSE